MNDLTDIDISKETIEIDIKGETYRFLYLGGDCVYLIKKSHWDDPDISLEAIENWDIDLDSDPRCIGFDSSEPEVVELLHAPRIQFE